MPDPPKRDIVVVVDDSPETVGFLTSTLKEAGVTVLVALDGEGALAMVERITPDVILLDAIMPGMDGFETCRRLKRMQGVAHVPVIFMTGLSDTDHIVKGFDAGGVDYVTKPIAIDELLARMRVHLANARLTQSTRLALDTAGRFLLAIAAIGIVRWYTPQAARLLGEAFRQPVEGGAADAREIRLPKAVASWVESLDRGETRAATASFRLEAGDKRLSLSYLGKIGTDEYLLRLTEAEAPSDSQLLRESLGLTAREAEVLAWIARGKSNRNISEILGISARTVDKHLEQIYAKLGVENRASAAALAVRVLGLRS
jgi:DNA-binding NarL/FixJ family response regulator